MRWGSIVLGFCALALFEGVVSRVGAAKNVGGFFSEAGRAVEWFVSPAVPAFATPSKASSASTSNTSLASTTTTASTGGAAITIGAV